MRRSRFWIVSVVLGIIGWLVIGAVGYGIVVLVKACR